jgi:hypothetical protein
MARVLLIRAMICSPEDVLHGATSDNDPDIRLINRSRASYGYLCRSAFRAGDPEWSRVEDQFDNAMMCSVSMKWQILRVLLS